MPAPQKRAPYAVEFRRVYQYRYGPMTADEARDACRRAGVGDYATLAERNAYEQAATHPCGFCLGIPVPNAARFVNPDKPRFAPCPRCGEEGHR